MDKITVTGTEEEINQYHECIGHYDMGTQYLDEKIPGFNKKDELFRSFIDEANWPYQSLVFDPRVFTFIFEKTSRLFARKPKGRLVPREGGDVLGAKISNELLDFQWDDSERVDAMPMLAKWSLMDQNARKYGASFALCKWHYETLPNKKDKKRTVFYDGPNFRVWDNRDVLVDPSYSSIKNWIQLRDYVTIQELENVNDAAKGKPIYKNIDILKDKLKSNKKGGDTRESKHISKNLEISKVSDQRGTDEVFKTIEIVTEYRKDRWITFSPRHGVVIRDIDNPYDHGQIPVVMLKYYPVDDDIYGLSEIEPVERLQKAINSLVCQYIDLVNMGLNRIVKVRAVGVQMHTLRWGPGEKWIMNSPDDVVPLEMGTSGISEFTSTYRFLVGALQEAVGETSAGISNAVPGEDKKTATEIMDTASQRNARDNFNQIFLSEALKKQMMFWNKMNAQFMFSSKKDKAKVIRIIGKDALRFFERSGFGSTTLPDDAVDMLSSPDFDGLNINPEDLRVNAFPVETDEGVLPKFSMDATGEAGYLLIEPADLSGSYDYIPDVESMVLPNEAQVLQAQKQLVEISTNPVIIQLLGQDGYKVKVKELLTDFYEKTGFKDADKYFEKMGGMDGTQPTGNPAIGAVPAGAGASGPQGMAAGPQAAAGVPNQELVAGPPQG